MGSMLIMIRMTRTPTTCGHCYEVSFPLKSVRDLQHFTLRIKSCSYFEQRAHHRILLPNLHAVHV